MKRIISVFLVFFAGLFFLSGEALADPPQYDGDINSSVSALLMDADSGEVLFEQNADAQIKPASTIKILTCIIALENTADLDQKVKIPAEGDWTRKAGDYSTLGTKKDELITMRDLLYGMMLRSGDDAADAVAILVGGSISNFVDMMNQKAQELEMTSSHFVNAGGLDREGLNVTARDMAKLTLYALKNPMFKQIVGTASYDMESTNKNHARTIQNTNSLLNPNSDDYYQYATGIKTGSTPGAGGCLVSSATKNGMNLICFVYGDKQKKGSEYANRYPLTKSLFEYGFNNYKTVSLSALMKDVEPVQVQVENYSPDDSGNGVLTFAPPDVKEIYVTLEKKTADDLTGGNDKVVAKTELREKIEAPIEKGDLIGTVTYSSEATGETLYTENLIAPRDVLEAGSMSTDGQTAVETLQPTPPKKVVTESDNSAVWYFMIIPAGLIVFLVVRIATVRRGKTRFKKYRKPHYSYRIK